MPRTESVHLTPPPLTDEFFATLQTVARQALGRATPEGAMLAAAVRDVSHYYTRDRGQVERTGTDMAPLSARLRFFLPRDLFKIWSPLSELWTLGALPSRKTLRVLDVGAGLGTSTLGVSAFAAHTGLADRLTVLATDQDARALSIMERLVVAPAGLPHVPIALTCQAGDLDKPHESWPRGGFDLVIVGLCLNELTADEPDEDKRLARALVWLSGMFAHVAEGGALIVVEPALRDQSRLLQRARDVLQQAGQAPFVFGPCTGASHCPLLNRERDWCHDLIRYPLARPLAELARAAGLRTGDLTFSYLTLHTQPRSLAQLAKPQETIYRVVGGPLRSKGKLEFDLCGAEDAPRLARLNRDRDRRHDVLATAQRGTVLGLTPEDCVHDGNHKRLRLLPGRNPRVCQARDR